MRRHHMDKLEKKDYILKQTKFASGILVVKLQNKDDRKTLQVHRLIAKTFCPIDDDEKKVVNHKDGNKTNNNINNLEWITQGQNVQHAHDNKLNKGS